MRFGLRSNPFEWASQDHKMVDRESEWRDVVRVLRSAILETDICRFVLIFGDYGMGKSFILAEIFRRANQTRGVLAVKDVITQRPIATRALILGSRKPEFDICRNMILGLGPLKVVELVNKLKDRLPKGKWGDVFNLIKAGSEDAWRYLTGDRLTKAELEALGVREWLRTPDAMVGALFEVLKLMTRAEYTTLLVLVDEFEFIRAQLGDKAVVAVLDALRSIFDEFAAIKKEAAKIVFVFGVSTQAWDKIMDLDASLRVKTGGGGIAPFTERILPSDRVTLHPWSEEATLQLVRSRLEEVRDSDSANPWAPFTESAVRYVHKISQQKPRLVLQNCFMVLEEAANDENAKTIDAELAKKVLERFNVATAPSEE